MCYVMKPKSSPRKILNVSITPTIENEVTSIAKQEQKTKSEVVRDAIRQYSISRSLNKIYAYGREQSQSLGIETYEDIEGIAG